MKKLSKNTISNFITYGIVIAAFVIVTILLNAGALSRSMKGQLVPICVYIVMAVSLNLTVGISGELSLGHAGFMSVGAFAGAIFCMATKDGIADPTVRLILGMLAGGVFALLTLRNAREEQAASAAADGTIPLAAVSGNDLTQIVLHYQGETNTLFYTADGWTLAEDPAYHLDTSACNTMLTALSSLNAKRELSPQAGEDYGFAEPALTIEVTAAGETDTYTFGASNTMTGDL